MRYLVSIVGIAVISASAMAGNLIVNGDFSNGFTGWHSYDGTPIVAESQIHPDQPYYETPVLAIRTDLKSYGASTHVATIHRHKSPYGNGFECDQLIELGTDNQYVLSFKYASAYSGVGVTVVMSFKDAAGNNLPDNPYFSYETPVSSSPYAFNTAAITLMRMPGGAGFVNFVPQDAAKASFRIVSWADGYEWCFDDISMDSAYSINFNSTGNAVSGWLRGQNVKATGSSDLESAWNKDTLSYNKRSSMRGVAGGLEADTYNWKTRWGRDVGSKDNNVNRTYKGRPTLEFLRESRDYKCEMINTVNVRGIGTGIQDDFAYTDTSVNTLAQLAADWVRYTNYIVQTYRQGQTIPAGRDLNIINSLEWSSLNPTDPFDPSYDKLLAAGETAVPKITYWEIGNEPKVTHGIITAITASQYVARYKTITQAMLAEDASIKVGPCITWADYEGDIIDLLLADPTIRVDFVSYHPYNLIYGEIAGGHEPTTAEVQANLDGIKASQHDMYNDIKTKFTAAGKPMVPLFASEWNPGSSAAINSTYQSTIAQALAITETIFSFAELNVSGAMYWLYPRYIYGENWGIDTTATMTFKQLQDYMGSKIVDSYSESNFRMYTTTNGPGNTRVIWGLNFSETDTKQMLLDLSSSDYDGGTVTVYKLKDINGNNSLLSMNDYFDFPVKWTSSEISTTDISKVAVTFDDASLTAIVIPNALKGDLNGDKYINLKDIAELAKNWLKCTDPENSSCQ